MASIPSPIREWVREFITGEGSDEVSSQAPVQSVNSQTGNVTVTAPVDSVNGETGTVSLSASDVGALASSSDVDHQQTTNRTHNGDDIEPDSVTTQALEAVSGSISNAPTKDSDIARLVDVLDATQDLRFAIFPEDVEQSTRQDIYNNNFDKIVNSSAINSFVASDLIMGEVSNNTSAMKSIVASDTAMESVTRSNTALENISTTQTAMDEVVTSQTALYALSDSDYAMDLLVTNYLSNIESNWTQYDLNNGENPPVAGVYLVEVKAAGGGGSNRTANTSNNGSNSSFSDLEAYGGKSGEAQDFYGGGNGSCGGYKDSVSSPSQFIEGSNCGGASGGQGQGGGGNGGNGGYAKGLIANPNKNNISATVGSGGSGSGNNGDNGSVVVWVPPAAT